MPAPFFERKFWKQALVSACFSSNTTAILSTAQAVNLISPNDTLAPIAVGGLVGIATEIYYTGLDFSVHGQLIGVISLFLNFMLPEYVVDFFDGNRAIASGVTSSMLALVSLSLATAITPQPQAVPAAPLVPLPKTKLRKQSNQPGSAGEGLAKETFESTNSQDQYLKEVALIRQTQTQIDKQHKLLVMKGEELLRKIAHSEEYLKSNICKFEYKKKDFLTRSNLSKKANIELELNAHKEKISVWTIQLNQLSLPGSHLEGYRLMYQQGQTLLANLSKSISNLQSAEQVMAERLEFEKKSIEAWKKKQQKVLKSQPEPSFSSSVLS